MDMLALKATRFLTAKRKLEKENVNSNLSQLDVVSLIFSAETLTSAGSVPDGVIGIFQLHNPSGRTMALGSTQPLTEMSNRRISWG